MVSTMTRCRETTESKVFEAERSTTATGRICCQRTNDDEAASRMLRGNYSTARACQKATCSVSLPSSGPVPPVSLRCTATRRKTIRPRLFR